MTEPTWTERTDKRGLDPLGIQNAGVNFYQDLLPGISNVTLRVRYYGFFCWVSDAYGANEPSTEFRAWKLWVRRAEATYALISAHVRGQGGVGGIEWADRRLAQGEDVIDFAEAASDDTSVPRYLAQDLGVFGGAYYTQMLELGLFVEGEYGIQRAHTVAGLQTTDMGEIDYDGGISKSGDAMLRTMLYEAAQILLTQSGKWSWLKAWGMRVPQRRGQRRAIVAVARRLAVILHRMWTDGTDFRWGSEPAAAIA